MKNKQETETAEEKQEGCATCGQVDAPKVAADNEEYLVCPECGGLLPR